MLVRDEAVHQPAALPPPLGLPPKSELEYARAPSGFDQNALFKEARPYAGGALGIALKLHRREDRGDTVVDEDGVGAGVEHAAEALELPEVHPGSKIYCSNVPGVERGPPGEGARPDV